MESPLHEILRNTNNTSDRVLPRTCGDTDMGEHRARRCRTWKVRCLLRQDDSTDNGVHTVNPKQDRVSDTYSGLRSDRLGVDLRHGHSLQPGPSDRATRVGHDGGLQHKRHKLLPGRPAGLGHVARSHSEYSLLRSCHNTRHCTRGCPCHRRRRLALPGGQAGRCPHLHRTLRAPGAGAACPRRAPSSYRPTREGRTVHVLTVDTEHEPRSVVDFGDDRTPDVALRNRREVVSE